MLGSGNGRATTVMGEPEHERGFQDIALYRRPGEADERAVMEQWLMGALL